MKKNLVKLILFELCVVAALLTLIITNILQINSLKKIVIEMQPTQTQRYFNTMIDDLLIESDVQFVELNKTTIGTVDELGNANYVIESTETKIVKVTITVKNNFLKMYDNSIDVNIYYNTLTTPAITYNHTQNTMSYTFALQKGFNTIELDNYANSAWSYTILIKENN